MDAVKDLGEQAELYCRFGDWSRASTVRSPPSDSAGPGAGPEFPPAGKSNERVWYSLPAQDSDISLIIPTDEPPGLIARAGQTLGNVFLGGRRYFHLSRLVGVAGFEPPDPSLPKQALYLLSYTPMMVAKRGIEPRTRRASTCRSTPELQRLNIMNNVGTPGRNRTDAQSFGDSYAATTPRRCRVTK